MPRRPLPALLFLLLVPATSGCTVTETAAIGGAHLEYAFTAEAPAPVPTPIEDTAAQLVTSLVDDPHTLALLERLLGGPANLSALPAELDGTRTDPLTMRRPPAPPSWFHLTLRASSLLAKGGPAHELRVIRPGWVQLRLNLDAALSAGPGIRRQHAPLLWLTDLVRLLVEDHLERRFPAWVVRPRHGSARSRAAARADLDRRIAAFRREHRWEGPDTEN